MIKKMVSKISVENRRQLWLTKNDKVRVRARCSGSVPYIKVKRWITFWANGPSGSSGKSKMEKTKKVDSQSQSTTNKDKAGLSNATAKISIKNCRSNVEETIKPNPKIPIAALKDQLQKKFELGVSRAKVIRAKQMEEDNVIGDYANQYARASGCFMSGPFPGQILTAVWVDPNNGTYPLAYEVVETETKESWTWFLDCLEDDLQLARNSNFTFITDRQKGLVPALQEMFPAAEHRYCLKHIYDNMKLSWRGQQYKELLWKSATSPTLQLFERNMEELRSLNKEVYDWLKGIPPHHWARSHFSGRPHCDVLLNNMCERTCSCKKWDLTGIPCKHAVACIWDMASNGQEPGIPESWVSECYWLSTWQDMYRFKINPCNGPNMWKKSPSPITLTPPNYHTPVGKLSRAGKSLTCNKCGQVGHNQRSCKGQRGPTVNESQVNASAFASARNSGQGANASAKPTVNQSQASQASVNPSAPTASQSQTFVRPTPSLIPTKPSVMNTAPFLRPTTPFVTASPSAPSLRPTTPFVTPRFTKNTTSRLSPIKKVAAKRGKGKNVKK
ncbi:mutator type transposase [Tanacetum coccineum]